LDGIVFCFHFFGTPEKVSPDLAQNFMRRAKLQPGKLAVGLQVKRFG